MKIYIFLLLACVQMQLHAQSASLHDAISRYFTCYFVDGYQPRGSMKADSIAVNDAQRSLCIYTNETFCSQPFTPQTVGQLYTTLQRILPPPYNSYQLTVCNSKQMPVEQLVPNLLRNGEQDPSRLWGKINYDGYPWVKNLSKAYSVTNGLQNRHLYICASHGRYYKQAEHSWQWQRPYLFCTAEDLFTQSFVYPYLIPMLENAGAIIGTPRERDYQTCSAIVDNDGQQLQGHYSETSGIGNDIWKSSADSCGYAIPPQGVITDSIHPFKMGTYRILATTPRRTRQQTVTWTPYIPQTGNYAVYVSYAARPNCVPDAHYTIFHKGGRTQVQVNQQMGGNTWVYLGTYEFEKGENASGKVMLSNWSRHRGVITADAVRFGGGMGFTKRDSAGTSLLPRYLEAARYYAQNTGIPDTLVNTEKSQNDYVDDLRVRGNMLNYLGGRSIYMPASTGQRIPFEMALSLHSDAGFHTDNSIFGSLGICTTTDGDGLRHYASGLSRQASADLASIVLNSLSTDLSKTFNIHWVQRELLDRNYAETRMPNIPSAILEMLSHQNFTDMRYGHDPLFKFTLARSVYKSVLRFVNFQHGIKNYTIQPLPVHSFAAELSDNGNEVKLSWLPTTDSLETSAQPNSYILYTQVGNDGFDNGTNIGNVHSYTLPISPNCMYAFRITAVNEGGESFPSETLTAYYTPRSSKRILIVNGFERLSGPATIIKTDSLGFDLNRDMGVPYMQTTAFTGRQLNFDPLKAGLDNDSALGFSGCELMGKTIIGNTFDYPVTHGKALMNCQQYSFCSASREAFEQKDFDTHPYAAIDYICGLQAERSYNLRKYPAFSKGVRHKLTKYLNKGGALLVSGSYIGSDNNDCVEERHFTQQVLKYGYAGSAASNPTDWVQGLNMTFNIYRNPNETHYAAQAPDALMPMSPQAFNAFAYGNGQGGGVAYKGNDYRVIAMGFPFECICKTDIRNKAMKALMHFLTAE